MFDASSPVAQSESIRPSLNIPKPCASLVYIGDLIDDFLMRWFLNRADFSLFACIMLCLALGGTLVAQPLKSGFDRAEYLELMKISARTTANPEYYNTIPAPERFTESYHSAVIGLDNYWDMWGNADGSQVVLSIRGTTTESVSWLANLYAAMVPATGKLELGKGDVWEYKLADNPRAAVHVGWLVSTAFLSRDMLPKIKEAYAKGTKNILIMGHSQGGAIAYLLNAYLANLQAKGELPADIRFKTYCSAGPKPGNLYFAYDYEARNQGGWAYNVVNADDWVPEMPLSVQTLDDINNTNPFQNVKGMIKSQPFPKQVVLNHIFKKLDKPSRAAQENYQKYLGTMASKAIKQNLNGFVAPDYYKSSHYTRCGAFIVLKGNADYFIEFPESKTKFFTHHFHAPYMALAAQLNNENCIEPNPIAGAWALNLLTTNPASFASLFPNAKPSITFAGQDKISGSTGCNRFNGVAKRDGNKITIGPDLAMTRMMCEGNGEAAFTEALLKVNTFSVFKDTLTLLAGDVAIMRLQRAVKEEVKKK